MDIIRVTSTKNWCLCPTCKNAITMEQHLELRRSWRPYFSGILCGTIGAVTCVSILSGFILWYPGVKQSIALYVMNYWT